MNKQQEENKTNTPQDIDTLSLLSSRVDAIYIIFHNMFRLLRPVRRKYNMSVNSLVVLNACYLIHVYNGSLFSVYSLYKFVGYYSRPKLMFYISYLINKGMLTQSDQVKNILYYRITDKGVEVMREFNNTYQQVLMKFVSDNGISL